MSGTHEPREGVAIQTIVALVESRPGVLDRIAGLLRRRSFDVPTLAMGRSEVQGRSRLTLTVRGDLARARRVADNLAKLVEVLHAEVLGDRPSVRRDLALIKIATGGDDLAAIQALCGVFRARVVDVSPGSAIVEITGDETKIERFRSLLEPFGVLEMARSECVAMLRGPGAPSEGPAPTIP